MIAVPGDTSAETISAIIADEAAIGMETRRRFNAPHRSLGSAPVMPVHNESAAGLIQRGGRISAPMQSLKN